MLLSLEHISKRYGSASSERVALEDISLELERGQMVGLYGPSGCGKTTLLRIAAGMQAPDGGAVTYDGQRLNELPSGERMRLRRREIACIWEEREHGHLSAVDHVAMPLLVDRRDHRTAQRRAREALLACEAEHCAGAELHELSDGERQRVTIARALVIEPRLLLADSPTSRLSIVEQEAIMALLSSLAHEAKVGVLIADSDAEALIGADQLLCMSAGRLIDAPQRQPGKVYSFPTRHQRVAADG